MPNQIVLAVAAGMVVASLACVSFYEMIRLPQKTAYARTQGLAEGRITLYTELRKHFGVATPEERHAAAAFIDFKDARICIVTVKGEKTIRFWE